MYLLSGIGGMGLGILLMIVVVWLIGRKDDRKPAPLPPDLIKFWEITINQKDAELKLMERIIDILIKEKP